jgi:hypothetical protein
MRIVTLTSFILLNLAHALTAQQPCDSSSALRKSSEPPKTVEVLETLKSDSYERDGTYIFRSTPLNDYPVRAFRNGTEIHSPSDFTIRGRQLILRGQDNVRGQDILIITYMIGAPREPFFMGCGHAPEFSEGSSILNRYLNHALASMISSSPEETEIIARRLSDNKSPAFSDTNTATTPQKMDCVAPQDESNLGLGKSSSSSLRMLDKAIRRTADIEVKNQVIEPYRSDSISASGVEGLGDTPVNTYFGLLSEAQSTPARSVPCLRPGFESNQRALAKEPIPQSLRMLQRRLEEPH